MEEDGGVHAKGECSNTLKETSFQMCFRHQMCFWTYIFFA